MLVLGLLVIFLIGSSVIFINIEITFVPFALTLSSSFLVGTTNLSEYVSKYSPDAMLV